MPKPKWQHQTVKFDSRGLDLIRPVDSVPAGYFPILTNAQSVFEGSIQARFGLAKYNTGTTLTAGIINNVADLSPTQKVVVVGGNVWIEDSTTQGSFSVAANNLFGTTWRQVNLIKADTFRPNSNWLYMFDRVGQAKINTSGTIRSIGLAPPQSYSQSVAAAGETFHIPQPAIRVDLLSPVAIYTTDPSVTGDFVGAPYFTAAAAASGGIDAMKPTESEQPSGFATVAQGLLNVTASNLTLTSGILKATLGRIAAADIPMGDQYSDDSIIAAYARFGTPQHVQEARMTFSLENPVTITSVNVSTSGTHITFTAAAHGFDVGDRITIQGLTCGVGTVRGGLDGNWTVYSRAANTFDVVNSYFVTNLTLTAGATAAAAGEVINFSKNYYTGAVEFATFLEGLEGDDTMEKLREEWALLRIQEQHAEGFERLWGRIDPVTSAAYQRDVAATRSRLEAALSAKRFAAGKGEWFPFWLKKKEFFRVGQDDDKSWDDVRAVRFTVYYNVDADTLDYVQLADWDMTPTKSGLNSVNGSRYKWLYTYYSDLNGIESNPCQVMPEGADVALAPVDLTLRYSTNAQVSHLKIYRQGGQLTQYHLVGTIPNNIAGGTTTWTDYSDDLSIVTSPSPDFDNDLPVTVLYPRTNYIGYSENIANSSWTIGADYSIKPNAAIAPDGSKTADVVEVTAATATVLSQTIAAADIPDGRNVTVNAYLKSFTPNATQTIGFSVQTTVGIPTYTSMTLGKFVDKGFATESIWQRFYVTNVTSTNLPVIMRVRNQTVGSKFGLWGVQVIDADQSLIQQGGATTNLFPSYYIKANDGKPVTKHVPKLYARPTIVFGPFLGKYLFGIRPYGMPYGLQAGGGDVEFSPGYLWWCKPGSPDAWPGANWIKVTSPAEPLQNGFIYNGKAYVFSKERLYSINLNPSGIGPTFMTLPTPCEVGLQSVHGLVVANKIYFVGKKGIYETTGGRPNNLIETSFIRPLFNGQSVNGYPPIDWAWVDEMRLTFEDPYLWFLYKSTAGGTFYNCLRYHTELGRWEWFRFIPNPDAVTEPFNNQIRFLRWMENDRELLLGDQNGFLYTYAGDHGDYAVNPIGGAALTAATGVRVRTGFYDQDMPEQEKLYGDIILEADIPNTATISVGYLTNDSTTVTNLTTALNGNSKRTKYYFPLAAGAGVRARSLALNFSWSTAAASPVLHEASFSFLPYDREATLLSVDWEDLGVSHDKYIWGCSLDCGFIGTGTKSLLIQADGVTQVTATFSIAGAAGVVNRQTVELSWRPFRGSQLRILPKNTKEWNYHSHEWLAADEAPDIKKWAIQWEPARPGMDEYLWGVELECDTKGVNKTLVVQIDGNTTISSSTINANGRTKIRVTWATIKPKTLRILTTDANPGYLYKHTWLTDVQGETEPPLVTHWDTNWETLEGQDYYVWGLEVECDTANAQKTITIYRDGGTSVGTENITANGRQLKRVTFSPVKATSLRMASTAVAGRLYRWRWLTSKVEAPLLDTFDSNWENLVEGADNYVWGIEMDVDCDAQTEFIVQRDGSTQVTKQTLSAGVRHKARLTWSTVKAENLKLSFSGSARLYTWKYLTDLRGNVEPPLVTHWDTNWEALDLRDYYVWGLEVEADTANSAKTISIYRDGGTLISNEQITLNGRNVARVTFAPTPAKNLRMISSAVAGRLYRWKWLTSKEEAPLLDTYDSNWDNIVQGGDTYSWGVELDVDCDGQTEFVVKRDGGTIVSTQTFGAGSRNKERMTWATVKAENLKLSFSGSARLHGYQWLTDLRGNAEPPLVKHWDTNWETIDTKDFYLWGAEIECDTVGSTKVVGIYRDGGTLITSESINTNGRQPVRVTFPAQRAKSLRIYSNAVVGRLYRWNWLTSKTDAPLIEHFDSNWEAPENGDFYVWGITLDVETTTPNALLDVTKDGNSAILTNVTVSQSVRKRIRKTWAAQTATNLKFNLDAVVNVSLGVTTTGSFRVWGWSWMADAEPPLVEDWDSNYEDDGNLEDKWISGLYLEMDSLNASKSFGIFIDGVQVTSVEALANGRSPQKLSFGPYRGVTMRYQSTAGLGRIYNHRWVWEPEPVQLTNMATNWSNLGYPHEKLVKGFAIEADTLGSTKSLQLRVNGSETATPTDINGSSVGAISINFKGRDSDEFNFDNMVRAHTVRLDPTDANLGRLYNIQWVFDTEPPAFKKWFTQERSFNQKDYSFLIDAQICIRCTGTVSLLVNREGTTATYSIASTSNQRRRKRVTFNAAKGKAWRFTLQSAGSFYVYNEDTEITVRGFRGGEPKTYKLPFEGGTQNP